MHKSVSLDAVISARNPESDGQRFRRNNYLKKEVRTKVNEHKTANKAKYSNPPTPDQGNFILFSMVLNLSELQDLLEKFPQFGDESKDHVTKEMYQSGRACTVAWSGVEGSNVGTLPWNGMQIGVVIDPNKIDAPYGDMFAAFSYDLVPDEAEIEGVESQHTAYVSKVKSDSKYAGKIIVERKSGLPKKQITNQATIIKGEDGHQIVEEGNIDVFAGVSILSQVLMGLTRFCV